MNTNYNRIKVADLETNQASKILKTNQAGELEFSDMNELKVENYNALDYIDEGKALDARQGKVLKDMIENNKVHIATDVETQITSAIPEDDKIVSRSKLFNWWQNIKSKAQTITGNWNFAQSVISKSFIKDGGTSSEYLMADGSVSTGVTIGDVSAIQSGIINNASLQELGGVDKTINGVRIGKGGGNVHTNTAIGYNILNSNTTGNLNTAIGFSSLFSNTIGHGNIAIGGASLAENTSGSNNIAIGNNSLIHNISGFNNITIGNAVGAEITTGKNNTIIGGISGFNSNDSFLVVIGDGLGNVALRKESDNSLLAPTLSQSLIISAGTKSLINKEYADNMAAVSNSTTTPLTSVSLTTAYPNALLGFRVHCKNITTGVLIYEKTSGGWLQYAATVVV